MQNSTASNDTSLTSTPSLMSNTANMPNTAINNAIDAFLACKGQFASVTFKSNPKPAAAFKGVVLEKIVSNVFRAFPPPHLRWQEGLRGLQGQRRDRRQG